MKTWLFVLLTLLVAGCSRRPVQQVQFERRSWAHPNGLRARWEMLNAVTTDVVHIGMPRDAVVVVLGTNFCPQAIASSDAQHFHTDFDARHDLVYYLGERFLPDASETEWKYLVVNTDSNDVVISVGTLEPAY